MFSLEWQVSDGNRHTPGSIAGLDLSSGHTRSSYADMKAFGRQGQDIPPTGSVYGFTGRERFFYLSFVFFPFPISFCFWRLPFSFPFPQIFSSPSKRGSQQCNTFSTTAWPDCRDSLCFFLFSLLFLFFFFCIISFVILSGRFLSFVPFLSTELWVHGIFWGSHGIKRGLLRA